jgi:hypothetical protein
MLGEDRSIAAFVAPVQLSCWIGQPNSSGNPPELSNASEVDPPARLSVAMIYALVPTWCRHDFGSVCNLSTKSLKLWLGDLDSNQD